DEKLVARGAVGVLPATDAAGRVPRVDEPEPRLSTPLARAHELLGRRVRVLLHAVVLVEGSQVPGYFGRDGRYKVGRALQLTLRVVEARHDERHYLLPEPALVNHAHGVEYVLHHSAQLPVRAVAHRL